jgi:hypothetical protein
MLSTVWVHVAENILSPDFVVNKKLYIIQPFLPVVTHIFENGKNQLSLPVININPSWLWAL